MAAVGIGFASGGSAAPATSGIARDQKPVQIDRSAFVRWRENFRTRALAKGIPAGVLNGALADLTPDPEILQLLDNQPEHTRSPGAYVLSAASDKRIAAGRIKLDEIKSVLDAVEGKFGVAREILVAIWGIETTYGTDLGSRSVVRSLATLAAFGGRRAGFGEQQLLAALRILIRGDIAPAAMTGSWAGAMGHTQFIPTTYNAFAVDMDGDGKRGVWQSPADALASAANYLRGSDWQPGLAWGWEVVLSQNFDYSLSGRHIKKTIREWNALGIVKADQGSFPNQEVETLLVLPMGARGPAFLVTRNFLALLRYNNAVSYALAVGHLGDRLAGGGPISTPWPTDVVPLGRAERFELQRLLVSQGYETGGIDGILGTRSRAAVRDYQRRNDLPEDGYGDLKLLERLRLDTPKTQGTSG